VGSSVTASSNTLGTATFSGLALAGPVRFKLAVDGTPLAGLKLDGFQIPDPPSSFSPNKGPVCGPFSGGQGGAGAHAAARPARARLPRAAAAVTKCPEITPDMSP